MQTGSLMSVCRVFCFLCVAVMVTMHVEADLDQGVEIAELDAGLGAQEFPADPSCGEHEGCSKAMIKLAASEGKRAESEGKRAESEAKAAKLQGENDKLHSHVDKLQLVLTQAHRKNDKLLLSGRHRWVPHRSVRQCHATDSPSMPIAFEQCPIRALGEVASEGADYDPVSSTNIARGKPTTQSSTMYWASGSRAVDGNTNPDFMQWSVTHTNTEDNPWWQVDLQAQRTVKSVRVVNRGDCCSSVLNLFTIKVGDQVCDSNLAIPEGETGDFLCTGGPLVGSTVRIELPGTQRVLTLVEVEVYEDATADCALAVSLGQTDTFDSGLEPGCYTKQPNGCAGKMDPVTEWSPDTWGMANAGSDASQSACEGRKSGHDWWCGNTDSSWHFVAASTTAASTIATPTVPSCQPCYDGTAYENLQACANCTGPGPTQCTVCSDSDALMPWRKNGTVTEGTCQEYKDSVQVREIPGTGSLEAMTMASVLGKWGKQNATVFLPAVAATGLESVELKIVCYVRKAVWCQARSSVNDDLDCEVEKESRLATVEWVLFPTSQATKDICATSGGRVNPAYDLTVCNDVPVNDVLQFANVTSPHDACAAVVKLL